MTRPSTGSEILQHAQPLCPTPAQNGIARGTLRANREICETLPVDQEKVIDDV